MLSSSQESDEERGFETVTDTDKPYIHCMMSGAVIGENHSYRAGGGKLCNYGNIRMFSIRN